MRLVMLSHKETWVDSTSPSGYSTIGGFPFHAGSIASLFDSIHLIVCLRQTIPPSGLIYLTAHNLKVQALPEPHGTDLSRKLALLQWLPLYLPALWQAIRQADALHAPVPGDIGLIGLLLALLQRKPLFVRHCGTWGEPLTIADRFLLWLLERIAGGSNVVLATGGSDRPPSKKNPNIKWIFSTSLSQHEFDQIQPAQPWDGIVPLRLVTVGRATRDKNMMAIIDALPEIKNRFSGVMLDILGDGEFRRELEARSSVLGLQSSVCFHGNVNHEQVLEILSRSHLFVFPTRTKEGFPKVVLEAMACGLPVIATRVSVIPNLLGDGAGILLDDTSARGVEKAVLQVASNPEKMAEMGRMGRQAAQGYTLEEWSAEIGEHLRKAWGPLKKA